MKKYRLITLCFFLFSAHLHSQHISDLKINEILINNVNNFDDEYGRHVPWIEIFNTAYNKVDIGGCYLTNDTAGLARGKEKGNWYRIPEGDPKTLMPKRSFIIFYLDNAPLYGTFHVNFDPRDAGSSNYIALIDPNGKTLIDIFEFPDTLRRTNLHSYGYYEDGVKEVLDENGNWVSNKRFLDHFTPDSPNKVFAGLTKSEQISKDDSFGIGLTIISMATVFIVLFFIYVIMKLFARLIKKKKVEPVTVGGDKTIKTISRRNITNEEVAAIMMGLHLYLEESHEEESEIITIETPSINYSPWAQKQFAFKKVQRKR
jgi:Na+-transporting methylmalonyl-CoA/oxaloacetate decarboxylase gamma subunit